VGVEIRDEDLPRAETYLSANYPQEMVTLLELYRDRAFGFDWLGDELKGMPVPSDWWTKRSRIKQLERAWDASPSPQDDKTKQLTRDFEARSALRDEIARTASPGALANGPYDEVTAEYYRLAFKLTRDTPYALVPEWYAERDRHLADNVADDIRRHPGCRIAIVTGADHHGPIMATIKTLRTNVVLVKLP
jgi:hypothetical protein